MKKIALFLLLAVLVLALAACGTTPADTTTSDPTLNQPAEEGTPLTVISCEQVSLIDGVRTYRITFSNGSTADFSVKDGADGAAAETLSVVSCQQVAFVNGVRTYRITFSNGSTANFSVKDGKDAAAPTVKSCVAVSTDENNVTTWRITFSDDSTADFTVANATPVEGDIDWEELITMIEDMTDLLTVKSPDMENANSTVSDSTKTAHGTYRAPNAPNLYITGWGFPMTKSVMFGDADTVYAKVTKHYSRLNITFPLQERQLAVHLSDAQLIDVATETRKDGSTKRLYRRKSSLPSRKAMQVLHLDRAMAYLEENGNN